ncbi:MAG TPA: type II toxin-antitoxin system VapC family toxin [Terriglobia bacterium]|nr:type II toxin-antitoxin system VapC family toxin [Terriglobia bacterium]
MTIIVDASVAAKWLFAEPDTRQARALLDDARVGRLTMLAPDLLPVEVASSLWKRVYRQGLEAEEVWAQYNRFLRVCPALVRISSLTDTALRLALANKHSVYDCLYVALALETQCSLLTADERLFRVFSPAYSQIQLLHDWTPERAG